ncbi:uncharacterized protein LOC133171950 [Saccostrea echinata]|uniref:uncharacterized protein LOC133171950 n=1 Tax=Saccostrea echinata TaxID=191078 RepID=UPI002A80E614|nr:uncharacterized protein LOC133171950 [Saccostrea echinata]
MKTVLYDMTKENMLQQGSSVILMNYIYKTDPTESIILTKNSKVMRTSNIDVGQELLDRGELIANPPPAETIPIKRVKSSPVKTLVSIQGRVVSEEMIRTVKVKGKDVQVKSVTIKDETESVKVSLWRNLSYSAGVGKFLSFTDVVVTSYNDEVSVSTTTKTTIQEKEPPTSVVRGSIIGFEPNDNSVDLLMSVGEEFPTYTVSADILVNFFGCTQDNVTETLQSKLPFPCILQVKNTTVESVSE